jgi:MoaA/NifB/PqqE/SkfB family radical SAM enzyme
MLRLPHLFFAARKKMRGLRRPYLEWIRSRDLRERRIVLGAMPAVVTLEMTARCNLVCVTCRRYHVHEEYSPVRGVKGSDAVRDVVGSSGYLEPHLFDRCLDLVRDTETVEMTGYGEPMLNPHFHDFARRLKKRGHRLGTITNGTILNESNIRKLIDNRFDMISVSVDGIEAETLKVVRGVDRETLFGNLALLKKMKAACGLGPKDAPRLGVCFVMARFNIREMPDVVRRLADLGLEHFRAQNLEACTAPEILGPHLLYTDPAVRAEAEGLVDETRRLCRETGIRVDITPIPTEAHGSEPEGADLDAALDQLRGTAALRLPPKRRYRPLDEIRAELGAPLDDAARAAARVNEAGDEDGPREAAAIAHLPARLQRENERCLDFFRYAYVAWNGKVLSCCLERHAVGDLNVETAESIWNGSVYRRLRRAYFEQGIRAVCANCSRIME